MRSSKAALSFSIWSGIVDHGVAYLTAGDELLILDIRDPISPVKFSRTTFFGTAPENKVLAEDLSFIPAAIDGGLNILAASNAALVEKAVEIARSVGREVISPDEARATIDLASRF